MAFVQPIEKDRSQVSFLGCHEGLPSLICNVACSRDGDDGIAQRVASEIAICFSAYLHRGRAMADAVAPGMSSRYYCDRDLRQPPRRPHPRKHPCRSLARKRRTIFQNPWCSYLLRRYTSRRPLSFNSGQINMGTILHFSNHSLPVIEQYITNFSVSTS